jgi:hypothetical protein
MFQSPHESQEAHQGRKGKPARLNYMASTIVLSLSPTVSPKRQRREKRNQAKTKVPFRKKVSSLLILQEKRKRKM